MSIQRSNENKASQACSTAAWRLNTAAEVEGLPDVLKGQILSLMEVVNGYDVSQHRPALKVLEGKVLSENEVLSLLMKSTSSTAWKKAALDEDELKKGSPEWFAKTFGVLVTREDIGNYSFMRDSRGRDDVWLVQVLVVPGHMYLVLDSQRANCSSEKLLTLDEASTFLKREA